MFRFEIVNFKDAEYITNLEFEEILQIIKVAEILGINALVDLSCAYIAIKIRGRIDLKFLRKKLRINKILIFFENT